MMPREKGAPPQIRPKGLADYLNVMSKSVFQSGMSWDVVEAKWAGTEAALHEFDPGWLASLSARQIDGLVKDTRLIRNRRKIEAISTNAARAIELEREYGSFKKYLNSLGDFDSIVKALRKDFKFLGESGCYHFLYVVREPVPDWHEWRESMANRGVVMRGRGAAHD